MSQTDEDPDCTYTRDELVDALREIFEGASLVHAVDFVYSYPWRLLGGVIDAVEIESEKIKLEELERIVRKLAQNSYSLNRITIRAAGPEYLHAIELGEEFY